MTASRLASALLAGLIFNLPLAAAEVVGVVSRVDLDKKQVLLEGRGAARGKMLTLVLVDATEVIFGREPGTPADLVVGKRVRVVTAAGGELATTMGVDPNGALKVQYDDGRPESLVAGEVVEVK